MKAEPTDLSLMHDIVVPPPAPWWPPAPGWYVLFGIVALSAVVAAVRFAVRFRKNAYRRAALAEVSACREAGPDLPARLSELLKRTALAAYPRERVAPLSGAAWLAFLDSSAGMSSFAAGPARIIGDGPYAPARPLDPAARDELLRAAEAWIRRHRGGEPC